MTAKCALKYLRPDQANDSTGFAESQFCCFLCEWKCRWSAQKYFDQCFFEEIRSHVWAQLLWLVNSFRAAARWNLLNHVPVKPVCVCACAGMHACVCMQACVPLVQIGSATIRVGWFTLQWWLYMFCAWPTRTSQSNYYVTVIYWFSIVCFIAGIFRSNNVFFFFLF